MSFMQSQVTVTTAATPLVTVRARRTVRRVLVNNSSAAAIFLGGATVSATNFGYKLAPGASVALTLDERDVPYAAVATGTAVVSLLHPVRLSAYTPSA